MRLETRFKSLPLATVALLWGMCALAQEKQNRCEAYFTAWRMWDPDIGIIPNMTDDQAKWWKKKGQRKYPEVCEDMQKATFVLLTVQWTEEQKKSVMRRHTATTTGQVNTIVGLTASSPAQPAQPIYGSQMQSFITTWWEREVETYDQEHVGVLLFKTKDGKALESGGELQLMASPNGIQLTGPKASKTALEWVVDAISLMGTSSRRSRM